MIQIKIATLNVKGLNNKAKAHKTLILLKSYNLDIIAIQETNLNDLNTRTYLAQQWGFDSFWTSKTAILAGKKNIKIKETTTTHEDRVIQAKIHIKNFNFSFTNVYAPPHPKDRLNFFSIWSPQIDEGFINILAGDFNVNINPQKDRISQAPIQNDPTRIRLQNLVTEFTDSANHIENEPFITFYQNTQGNQRMATRLDYIFLEANFSHFKSQTQTRFGNSDHLLVECTI
jgi:exonuclease III